MKNHENAERPKNTENSCISVVYNEKISARELLVESIIFKQI